MSYDSQTRKVKDREICSDLSRLEEDVTTLQRKARRGYNSAPSSWHSDSLKGPTNEDSALEVMKKKYQDDFCRLKDQHFEEKRELKSSISTLETELHNLKKEMHILNSEYLVLSHTQRGSNSDSDVKRDRTIQKLGVQLQESESQVVALRASLVDAIEAIKKQYSENIMLVRQLQKRGVTVHASVPETHPTTTGGDSDQTLTIMSNQNRRLASELQTAEDTIRELGVMAGHAVDDEYASILQSVKQKLSQKDSSTKIKNLELQLQQLRVDPVAEALSGTNKDLELQLKNSEKQLSESNQIQILNEGEIKRQATQLEELKLQFKNSCSKNEERIRDLTLKIESTALAEQYREYHGDSSSTDIKALTEENSVLSKQKMEGLEAIRVLTAEINDIKQLKDDEINSLKRMQLNLTERVNQLSSSEDKIKDMEVIISERSTDTDKLQALNDSLKLNVTNLQNKLDDTTTDNKSLKSQQSELQIINDTLQASILESKNNNTTKSQLDSLENDKKDLKAQLQLLSNQLENCQNDSDDRVRSLQTEHQSTVSLINEELAGKQHAYDEVQKQVEESERELANIQLQKEVLARKVARLDDLEIEIDQLRSNPPANMTAAATPLVDSLRSEIAVLSDSNASLIEANVYATTQYKQRLVQILQLSDLHKETTAELEGKVCF